MRAQEPKKRGGARISRGTCTHTKTTHTNTINKGIRKMWGAVYTSTNTCTPQITNKYKQTDEKGGTEGGGGVGGAGEGIHTSTRPCWYA